MNLRQLLGFGPRSAWPTVRFAAVAATGAQQVQAPAARTAQRAAQRATAGTADFGRMYANAMPSATSAGFGGGTTSADAELRSSLATLRSRSRQLMRDAAFAKRARTLVVNNVIGQGVGLQAHVENSRGQLHTSVNDAIEVEWAEWCAADSCHTGGALAFGDLERAAMAQVFDAGEVFLRVHMARFGRSRVPMALELIEAERIADQLVDPGTAGLRGELRMGIEVDQFQRALRYWVRARHPGDIYQSDMRGPDTVEGVMSSDIFHLRIIDRWPQTRSEPWLHTALRKLDDINEVTGLEVQAARGSAAFFGTVESNDDDTPPMGDDDEDDAANPVVNIDPLTVQHMDAGKHFKFHQPTRPNTNLDPFVRFMLREISAAAGPSYESLSRDYSQSNYSSSRLSALDDKDLWRVLQQWWIRSFRLPLHRLWVQQATLAGALAPVALREYAANPRKFEAVTFKPRGWTWVDPTKEVAAFKEAVKAGFTTVSDVIAQTAGGQDLEDMLTTRKRELQLMADAGVEVDTTVVPAMAADGAAVPASEPVDELATGQDNDDEAPANASASARVLRMARSQR